MRRQHQRHLRKLIANCKCGTGCRTTSPSNIRTNVSKLQESTDWLENNGLTNRNTKNNNKSWNPLTQTDVHVTLQENARATSKQQWLLFNNKLSTKQPRTHHNHQIRNQMLQACHAVNVKMHAQLQAIPEPNVHHKTPELENVQLRHTTFEMESRKMPTCWPQSSDTTAIDPPRRLQNVNDHLATSERSHTDEQMQTLDERKHRTLGMNNGQPPKAHTND